MFFFSDAKSRNEFATFAQNFEQLFNNLLATCGQAHWIIIRLSFLVTYPLDKLFTTG